MASYVYGLAHCSFFKCEKRRTQIGRHIQLADIPTGIPPLLHCRFVDGPLLDHCAEITPRVDLAQCGPSAVCAGGDELGKADLARQSLFPKVIADLLPRDSHPDLFDLVEANELFLPVLGYLVDEGWQAIYPLLLGLQLQQLHIDERL